MKRQNHTIGDALIILILVLFILVWVGGFLWIISNAEPNETSWEDEGFGLLLFVGVFVISPCIWVGKLITHVVMKNNDHRPEGSQRT